MKFSDLPERKGDRPKTTRQLPHTQLDQNSNPEIYNKLVSWMFSQDDVDEAPSGVSVPGSRAMILNNKNNGNRHAFMVGREFAHIHPDPYPGSLHLMLTAEDARVVIAKGWGENHYLVDQGHFAEGLIMVFAPRNEEELQIVQAIIHRSMHYAKDNNFQCGCDHYPEYPC